MTRHELRLRCAEFYVDLHLIEHQSRWLAVAHTPDGPSMGWGAQWFNATIMALQPFDGRITELMSDISPRQQRENTGG